MRLFVIIFCLAVCYVSLPVTSRTLAKARDAAAEAAPDASEKEEAAEATPSDAEPTKSTAAESKSADAVAEEKAEEKPADDAEKKSDDTKSEDAKPAADKADDKEAEEKKEEKKERKTHTVDTKRMKVDVTLDGTFTAEKMTPVALRPEEWSQYEIVEIVPHGSEVHKGQTLVKFDTEKLNETIADLELEQRISELTLRRMEEELPRLEKTLKMTADEAERLSRNTQEDYDRYHKIDRPLLLKSVENMLKIAQFNVDYEQEELDQLEKMYDADDLTEETEEIILKRQRAIVEFVKFNFEQTKLYRDEILDIRLPRNDIQIKESLEKVALELAKAQSALAIDLNRARYELEQLKQARVKSLDKHAKLLADRGLMELKSPADGVLYYGECEDGNWSDMATMISKLKPEQTVQTDAVLMTVLERRPLEVLAQVSEDDRPNLKVGQTTRVVPPSKGAASLAAKVKSVSAVPVTAGKFAVVVDITQDELPEWIAAGVTCKAKVNIYDKADALVVPTKAIHTDEHDDEVKYVWIVDPKKPEAKAERRNVKLGKAKGDDTEITSGLAKGDVVSLEDEEAREKEAKEKADKEAKKS
jgi:HlyD family secretion protein